MHGSILDLLERIFGTRLGCSKGFKVPSPKARVALGITQVAELPELHVFISQEQPGKKVKVPGCQTSSVVFRPLARPIRPS